MNYKPYPTCYWADDSFLGLSFEQKALFNYLLIGPYGSQCGIFKLPIKTMGFHLGYTERPIENAVIGLCAAFSDFVAWDQETGEVALLQYPRQLHLSATPKILSVVEKDLQDVKSQTLLRLLIDKNSSTLSKPYLTRLRQLQAQKINEKKANCEKKFDLLEEPQNDGDLHNLPDNQYTEGKRNKIKRKEIKMQGSSDFSFSFESEILELENEAPQVNAKTLENDSSAPSPLSVESTQTTSDDEFVNLDKDEYKRELERWLRKNHSKFTRNHDELTHHLDNAWKNDFKFDDTRGSIMGGEKFFTYSKKFYEDALARKPKGPDKTQIRKAARELFEKCKANWKDSYRTYPAHLQIQIDKKGIKNIEEIEISAIEKVLSGNNPQNATLLYEMHNKMSAQIYDYMKCEWGVFIKKEKEVMKILTDEYYSLKLLHVEGWPKQQQ